MKHTLKTKGKSLKLTTLAFTLIELLAVIVILAIIALIATPIVLDIIDDTNESATLRSAGFYLDAVEQAVMREKLKQGASFNPNSCEIIDGNLYCDGDTDPIEVEVSGKTPTSGEILFENGIIKDIQILISERSIENDVNGQLVFSDSYYIGKEVKFNPGDGERTWYVVDENKTTLTLILNENLGNPIEWISLEDYCEGDDNCNALGNDKGPITALNYLNTLTTNWDNVDPIDDYVFNYNKDGILFEDGFRKIEINDGITIITSLDNKLYEISGETKARFITEEEMFKIELNIIEDKFDKQFFIELIEENLEEIKTKILESPLSINLNATTALELSNELEDIGLFKLAFQNENLKDIYILQQIVGLSVSEFGIDFGIDFETEFLEHAKDFFYANLDGDVNGYYTYGLSYLASCAINKEVFTCSSGPLGSSNGVYGVRPVITISKNKL